jgi:hypothetical protein
MQCNTLWHKLVNQGFFRGYYDTCKIGLKSILETESPESFTMAQFVQTCATTLGIKTGVLLTLFHHGEEIEFWRSPNELLSNFLKEYPDKLGFTIHYINSQKDRNEYIEQYRAYLTKARKDCILLCEEIPRLPESGPLRSEKCQELSRVISTIDSCNKEIEAWERKTVEIQKRLEIQKLLELGESSAAVSADGGCPTPSSTFVFAESSAAGGGGSGAAPAGPGM